MFCAHCGKSNVENASFCAYCGKAIRQSYAEPITEPVRPKNTEWEYNFYGQNWDLGEGGHWNLTFGRTEYDVRLDNWGANQDSLMPKIQLYLDDGWQLINPPGPNSYRFKRHKDTDGLNWLELDSFIVEFRRPARPRTEKEKELLGVWQEVGDPNKGFFKQLGNVILSQRLTIHRWRYEFFENRTFGRTDYEGRERDGGIFFENKKGGIEMLYKFSPDLDSIVNVIGNKLYTKPMHPDIRPDIYERVS